MRPAPQIDSGGRIRELDGWRAISVLLVIFHHLAGAHANRVTGVPGMFHLGVFSGPLGVKVFFVISGFVICRLMILEEARFGSVSLRGFYYRRIFRILPPLYLYLAAVAVLLGLGLIRETWKGIAYAVLFLYDTRLPPGSWHVGHIWSLSVEEHFYLTFPAAWILTPARWKGRVAFAIFCLLAAWNLSLLHSNWDALTYSETRTGFSCITFGVMMAICEQRARRAASRVPAVVVILAAVFLVAHPIYNAAALGGVDKSLLLPAITENVVVVALNESVLEPAAIALVLLFSLEAGAWQRRLLCSSPLQAIGVTSYGIYLWQQLFTAPKEWYAGAGAILPKLLPLMLLIVPVSYMLLEKPAMRFGRKLSQRLHNNPPVSAMTT